MAAKAQSSTALFDRIITNLNKARDDRDKIEKDILALAEQARGLALDISAGKKELEGIGVEIKETERAEKADLAVRLVENEREVLDGLLAKFKLAYISAADLSGVTAELSAAKRELESGMDEIKDAANEEWRKHFEAEKVKLQSAHEVEMATLKAENESQKQRIVFLSENVDNLRSEIAAERETRVKVAEATKPQDITVNS